MEKDIINIRFKLKLSDIVLMSTVGLAILALNLLYFKDLTLFYEGKLVSNYQAIILLIAGIVTLINANRQPWKKYKHLYVVLGLFLLFVMFEEIDWGQPFFKFDSPEAFVQVAYQQEFSIHHLVMGMVDIPVHLLLTVFSALILLKWQHYDRLWFINKLPKLSKPKYGIFIFIAIYYAVSAILLYTIPMFKHGFTIFTMKEKFSFIFHDHYHEIIEALEYTLTLVLVSFKPKNL